MVDIESIMDAPTWELPIERIEHKEEKKSSSPQPLRPSLWPVYYHEILFGLKPQNIFAFWNGRNVIMTPSKFSTRFNVFNTEKKIEASLTCKNHNSPWTSSWYHPFQTRTWKVRLGQGSGHCQQLEHLEKMKGTLQARKRVWGKPTWWLRKQGLLGGRKTQGLASPGLSRCLNLTRSRIRV